MRHLRSILYALVLAPAVWVLCGVGFTRELTGRARDTTGSVETVTAILLLVLAGAAYAILVFAPISPLGPALAGLVFLGVAVWALSTPDGYAGWWPAAVTKEGFDLSRPGYALAALLAVPMLCTALSMRRWAGYEPPVLPLIGTLGRSRGRAAAQGTPVAAEQTAVISTADPTQVIPPADPTQVIPPADPAGVGPVAAGSDELTQPVAADQLTQPLTTDQLTQPLTTDRAQPVVADQLTQPLTTDTAQPVVADQLTQPETADEPAEPETAGEPGGSAEDDGPADAGERTQLLSLPADPDGPTHPIDPGSVTRALDAGERTQVIRRDPAGPTREQVPGNRAAADQTARDRAAQERSRQAFRDRAAQERSRQAFEDRAAGAAQDVGESTQRIAVPGQPGDDAAVSAPGAGSVEPPGDRTQALRIAAPGDPAPGPIAGEERPEPGDDPATRPIAGEEHPEPGDDPATRPIAGEERPDPRADPTTRLSPEQRPGTDPGGATTADVGPRPRSVLDLERPADEADDDTRRLPGPPRPTGSEEPTHAP